MIDFNNFLDWAKSNFNDYKIAGKDIKLNSIFCQDEKFHLYCCPKKNAFHCFKSRKHGTLPYLVTLVDGCDYATACEKLGAAKDTLHDLEVKLEEFFEGKKPAKEVENKIAFPENTFRIASLSQQNRHRLMAEKYMNERKLPVGNLLICTSGKYQNRIIIPYYGPSGELIYWNSRDISGKSTIRYLGPEKEKVKVGKEDVLWMSHWPRNGTKIYLTEGEFDGMALNTVGLHGVACGGKYVSSKQIELLRSYKIAIAFDADKSGVDALNNIIELFEHEGIENITYVKPPKMHKDWNELLKKEGQELLMAYIQHNEKPINSWTANTLKLFSR